MLILGAANLFLINVVFIADDPERTGKDLEKRFYGDQKYIFDGHAKNL